MANQGMIRGTAVTFLFLFMAVTFSQAKRTAVSDISISITKPATGISVKKLHIDVSVDFADAVAPISTIQLMVNSEVRDTFTNTGNLAKGKHTFKAVDISDLVGVVPTITLVARAFEGDPSLNVFADSSPVALDSSGPIRAPIVTLTLSCSVNPGGQLEVNWSTIWDMFKKIPVDIGGSVIVKFFNGGDEQVGTTFDGTWDTTDQFVRKGNVPDSRVLNIPGGAQFATIEVRVEVVSSGLKPLPKQRRTFPDITMECPIGS